MHAYIALCLATGIRTREARTLRWEHVDHPVFRDGLAGLLATLPEVEVAGTADTAEQALAAIKETAPAVVLMDITCPAPPALRRSGAQLRSPRAPPCSW